MAWWFFVYLLLYVDDMLIVVRNTLEIRRLKRQFSSEFEIKGLEVAKKILAMEIYRDRWVWKSHLLQKRYIYKVLECFDMKNVKLVSTLLASYFKLSASLLSKSKEKEDKMPQVPYSSVVSRLMYIMICTCPNISQTVSVVSRYMTHPGNVHWQAVK